MRARDGVGRRRRQQRIDVTYDLDAGRNVHHATFDAPVERRPASGEHQARSHQAQGVFEHREIA